jgi:hypothetical protein
MRVLLCFITAGHEIMLLGGGGTIFSITVTTKYILQTNLEVHYATFEKRRGVGNPQKAVFDKNNVNDLKVPSSVTKIIYIIISVMVQNDPNKK